MSEMAELFLALEGVLAPDVPLEDRLAAAFLAAAIAALDVTRTPMT